MADLVAAERIMIQWAKTALAGVNGSRVSRRLPLEEDWGGDSFITCLRVGGAPDTTMPLDNALIQWDVYAKSGTTKTRNYTTCETVTTELLTLTRDLARADVPGHGVIMGAVTIGVRSIEEPDTLWARYSIDQLVTTHA